MWVEDVGTGVGKAGFLSNVSLDLFKVFGNAGEEDNGSKAGSREAADFFLATLAGSALFREASVCISLSCSWYPL